MCDLEKQLQEEYLTQLTQLEKVALKIAQEDLESSFSLEKSIGYLNWKASRTASE